MDDQSSPIEKHLLELLDPSTTPEKALQSLSSPCLSRKAYTHDEDPVLIFLAYMRFIVTRLPDACVDGIWEDILRRTVKYSVTITLWREEITSVRRRHTRVVLADGPIVSTWFQQALSTHLKCPNPYIRLEMFRLIRILLWNPSNKKSTEDQDRTCATLESICGTFIHTISEIQPHHFYPSYGVDKVMFNFTDLIRFIFDIYEVLLDKRLQKMISDGINKQLKKDNDVDVDSDEARFISHCIQLIGIFSIMPGVRLYTIPHISRISQLCGFFKNKIGRLIYGLDINQLHGKTPWVQFRYVLSLLPFNPYIIATICDLRAAMFHTKLRYAQSLATQLDSLAVDLDVCSKACDLPQLLLCRQLQGPRSVRQHALLAKKLEPLYFMLYRYTGNEDEDDSDNASAYVDSDTEFSEADVSDAEDSNNEDSKYDVSNLIFLKYSC
ncbi:unnamed protein product [Meganyctiphanes norvegica]|uniref:Uncharacterized protein n=1 Tax=Meganyctiphanes norvegica TaxID=48144 RepID=A0AAV2RBQ0_MEGNR